MADFFEDLVGLWTFDEEKPHLEASGFETESAGSGAYSWQNSSYSNKTEGSPRSKEFGEDLADDAFQYENEGAEDAEGDFDEEDSGEDNPVKRKKVAIASRLARQRRKHEMDRLRLENEQLIGERTEMIKKIGVLEEKVKAELGQASLEDMYENELLKEQIMLHARFLNSFENMVKATPSQKTAKRKIYKEGADQARTILLGLVADSQCGGWHRAVLPPLLAENNFMRVEMYFRFTDNLFEQADTSVGKAENSKKRKGKKLQASAVEGDIVEMFQKRRLQMRFDITFLTLPTEKLRDGVRKLLIDQRAKLQLWGIPDDQIELKPLHDELNEENTMLLYHRKHYPPPKQDRDIVFLFDQHQQKMARSTLGAPKQTSAQEKRFRAHTSQLAPPKQISVKEEQEREEVEAEIEDGDDEPKKRKRGRPVGSKGKKERTWSVGEVDVTVLTRTSTTLLAGASKSEGAHRITSPVMHGALVFEEEEIIDGDDQENLDTRPVTKVIVMTSTPQEFSEQREVEDWNRILKPDGAINPRFAFHLGQLLRNIFSKYSNSK